MHGAPSVSYPVGRSLLEAGVVVTLALAAAAGLAGWAALAAPGTAAVLLAVMPALCAAAWALAGWWRTRPRRLAWDGQGWLLDGAALSRLDRVADLQAVLLLRCRRAGGGSDWIWAEGHADPAHWLDLRRAVYSRATPDSPPVEPSPTAET